jgi:hypothetical protein
VNTAATVSATGHLHREHGSRLIVVLCAPMSPLDTVTFHSVTADGAAGTGNHHAHAKAAEELPVLAADRRGRRRGGLALRVPRDPPAGPGRAARRGLPQHVHARPEMADAHDAWRQSLAAVTLADILAKLPPTAPARTRSRIA